MNIGSRVSDRAQDVGSERGIQTIDPIREIYIEFYGSKSYSTGPIYDL